MYLDSPQTGCIKRNEEDKAKKTEREERRERQREGDYAEKEGTKRKRKHREGKERQEKKRRNLFPREEYQRYLKAFRSRAQASHRCTSMYARTHTHRQVGNLPSISIRISLYTYACV